MLKYATSTHQLKIWSRYRVTGDRSAKKSMHMVLFTGYFLIFQICIFWKNNTQICSIYAWFYDNTFVAENGKNVYEIVYKKCLIFLYFVMGISFFCRNRPKNKPFRWLEKWIWTACLLKMFRVFTGAIWGAISSIKINLLTKSNKNGWFLFFLAV